MAINPMHQFEVYKVGPEINLGGINLSFTNASLFMTISAILISSLLFFGTKKKSLIPSKIQLITEMSYTFIAKMINDTAGSSAKAFFPFVFTLFMFVLFCNMIGMLPYSFTVTSQIIVTSANDETYLYAWFDWDQNYQFDADEITVSKYRLNQGDNSILVNVPDDAVMGSTWSRFRVTDGSETNPITASGGVIGGEVEDYSVTTLGSLVYPGENSWVTLAFEDKWPFLSVFCIFQ